MKPSSRLSTPPPTVPIAYNIAGCSEHSGKYVAENIIVDAPTDQASRWSGAQPGAGAKQWVLLKLEEQSVVKSITFGKFHRKHPCNMKEFKLYVGLSPEHMIHVLHTGLKDDAIPETFAVRHVNREGIPFPVSYIKIVPLSAHGQSFHISIWHVAISGITERAYVDRIRAEYDEYREAITLRRILKHLRQRRLLTPYTSILARSSLTFEHPLLTTLHTSLVLDGSFARAESLLAQISAAGLFDDYLRARQPHAAWTRLEGVDADGDACAPSRRGGHAMCIDPDDGVIYLFGGWDGHKSLADFWAYDIKTGRWRVISANTEVEKNGPVARSCHKMCFCARTGCIYLLGRMGDGDIGAGVGAGNGSEEAMRMAGENPGERPTALCSEFYRYHTRGLDVGKWDLLSFDTASSGGPPLIYDHQMVMDSDAQILYVSGGRLVDADIENPKYAAFYSYNVRTSKWRLLQPPSAPSYLSSSSGMALRFGHSMVLDSASRTLFIFAGQREDRYLADMYAYDIETNTVTELFSNFSAAGGPDSCFTQRAVVDVELREIYVFCGLTRAQQSSALTVLRSDAPNWVYRYDRPSRPGQWTQILPLPAPPDMASTPTSISTFDPHNPVETMAAPIPRYAHQVVYDARTRTVFMHGGNSGEARVTGAEGEGSGGARVRDGHDNERGESADERSDSGDEGDHRVRRRRMRKSSNETRLDDFWRMALVRAMPEEVIRQGRYLIRRQQFREMCESQPYAPVQALRFLQTEVSAVVNHDDPEEAGVFRSLLEHLLSPAPPPPADTYSPLPLIQYDNGDGNGDDAGGREPPKKRSRSNSPEGEGAWTSSLEGVDDADEVMALTLPAAEHSGRKRTHAVLSMDPDPLELELEAAYHGQESGKGKAAGTGREVSAERFQQRTEVFEGLLAFVAECSKEPRGSLLDMVDVE
ncbi:Muskelin N-terminus-domain-containing protein, partial [Hygrophoropsis aurantiaca]